MALSAALTIRIIGYERHHSVNFCLFSYWQAQQRRVRESCLQCENKDLALFNSPPFYTTDKKFKIAERYPLILVANCVQL